MSDQPAPSNNHTFKSIRVQNLLSFGPDSPEIELQPLNIIIGENGVGKSNLLTVFEMVQHFTVENGLHLFVEKSDGASQLIHKGDRDDLNSKLVRLSLTYGAEKNSVKTTVSHNITLAKEASQFGFVDEVINVMNNGNPRYFIQSVHEVSDSEFNKVYIKEPGKDDIIEGATVYQSIMRQRQGPFYIGLDIIRNIYRSIGVFKETDFGIDSKLRNYQRRDKKAFLGLSNDLGNLFEFLEERVLSNFENLINDYLSKFNFEYSHIKIEEAPDERIVLELYDKKGNKYRVMRISDGTLHFIVLLAILLYPDPAPPLVCIEEPENGLHPDAIHLVAELLKEASKRMQIIVTTHSAHLISYFSDMPEAIMVAEKDERGTVFNRLTERQKEMIGDVGLGTIWLQGKIGGVK